MADRVSVTSSKSWFGRIGESIKSVLVGFVLFVVAFPVLFWNEGRAVQTARSLDEGQGAVVSVAADAVAPANEGKLVHVSGPIATDAPVRDEAFGVEAKGVKLFRTVEMYQWTEESKSETRKKLGGGEETVTTYTYSRQWKEGLVDSSSFHETSGHENPTELPVESESFTADPVRLGAFTLAQDQIDRLSTKHDVPVTAETAAAIGGDLAGAFVAHQNALYQGENPESPQVGDLRVTFEVADPQQASVVAVQSGDGFAPYQAAAGDSILLVDDGMHTAQEMFQSAQKANTVMTWILRFVGWLLMFLGLGLLFRPIAVFADVVPLFGTMLGAGLGLFSFLVASALSTITVGVAWIFYRPVLGVALLALAAAAIFVLVSRGRKKAAQRVAAAPVAA